MDNFTKIKNELEQQRKDDPDSVEWMRVPVLLFHQLCDDLEAREARVARLEQWIDSKRSRFKAGLSNTPMQKMIDDLLNESDAQSLAAIEAQKKRITKLEKNSARYLWLRDEARHRWTGDQLLSAFDNLEPAVDRGACIDCEVEDDNP